MRKLGYTAECVEHRRGSFIRVDLFGFADVIAFKHGEGIILIQAYHKKDEKIHAHMNSEHPIISKWLLAGGKFFHHQWTYKIKNGRRYWNVMAAEIR